MIFHLTVIFLMSASVAAFLILWYFWAKRKLGRTFLVDNEEHFLFPFRYFSWLLIGLVVLTCLVQVHFLRVSSKVHERLAAMSVFYQSRKVCTTGIEELKGMIDTMRGDLNSRLSELAARKPTLPARTELREQTSDLSASDVRPPGFGAPARPPEAERLESKAGFATAAGAHKAARLPKRVLKKPKPVPTESKKVWSMKLNLRGRVKADVLLVRKFPSRRAGIVEKLVSGARVRITEKRITHDKMWFKVITPSGKLGWVDFRYLKVQTSSRPVAGA